MSKQEQSFGVNELVMLFKKTARLPKPDKENYRNVIDEAISSENIWWDVLEYLDKEVDLLIEAYKEANTIPLFDHVFDELNEKETGDENWCFVCDNPIAACTCAADQKHED